MDGRSLTQIEVIHKRIGHIVASYRHYILVWGGFVNAEDDKLYRKQKQLLHNKNESSVATMVIRSCYCPADQLWFYNCITGVWTLGNTTGQIPHRTSGSTGLVLDDFLYIFGGMEESPDETWRHKNELYRLNLISLSWERLTPVGPQPHPCDKGAGWVYDNKLYFFGGYGPRPRPGSTIDYVFFVDILNASGHQGWNNNFFGYDPAQNIWFKPKTKGRTPDPRAAHSAAIAGNKAFIFGGRVGEFRNNDLIGIDMDTLTWGQNLSSGLKAEALPEGRSWLSLNFISPTKAVVYGGLGQYGIPAMDWWECSFSNDWNAVEWTKCVSPIERRVWHQAAFCETTGELVIIGGVSESPYDMAEEDHVDKITILKYQPTSLYRLSLNAVVDKYVNSTNLSKYCILPKVLLDLVISRAVQNGQHVAEL